MDQSKYGLIFAILSPLFSSISTIFKAGAAKSLTPLVVVGIGGLIGSILLFLLARIFKEKNIFQKIKNNWKDLVLVILLRSLIGELFFTVGLSQTEAVKAIFFTKIEPYFVLIISWFLLKEKIKGNQLLLLVVHLFGAVMLSTGGKINIGTKAQIGDLFIIIAMALFAISYNFGKKVSHNIGPISGNAVSMGASSLIILPFILLFSPLQKLTGQTSGWIYLFAYVVLFNVIALTLWYASLKAVKGWIVSSLRYIGPVLGAPFAYFLFKETLNTTQIIGAGIIIVTSFIIVREHLKTSKPASEKDLGRKE